MDCGTSSKIVVLYNFIYWMWYSIENDTEDYLDFYYRPRISLFIGNIFFLNASKTFSLPRKMGYNGLYVGGQLFLDYLWGIILIDDSILSNLKIHSMESEISGNLPIAYRGMFINLSFFSKFRGEQRKMYSGLNFSS